MFVASDDLGILSQAAARGSLIGSNGTSQQLSQRGSVETSLRAARAKRARSEDGYAALLEVVADLLLLASCRLLVGSISSQIFRLAAALGNASGILEHALIVDPHNLLQVY
jgi:hypothetical protein